MTRPVAAAERSHAPALAWMARVAVVATKLASVAVTTAEQLKVPAPSEDVSMASLVALAPADNVQFAPLAAFRPLCTGQPAPPTIAQAHVQVGQPVAAAARVTAGPFVCSTMGLSGGLMLMVRELATATACTRHGRRKMLCVPCARAGLNADCMCYNFAEHNRMRTTIKPCRYACTGHHLARPHLDRDRLRAAHAPMQVRQRCRHRA